MLRNALSGAVAWCIFEFCLCCAFVWAVVVKGLRCFVSGDGFVEMFEIFASGVVFFYDVDIMCNLCGFGINIF